MYGPECREVTAVVVAAHDDEGMTTLALRAQRRERQRLEEQSCLAVDVLERVLREQLELDTDRLACGLEALVELRFGEHVALGDGLAVAPDLTVRQADDAAVTNLVEQVRAIDVDERDPGLDDPQRPDVRVTPGGRRRGVDDREHSGFDEAVRGNAVEVLVPDHRDLAGRDALQQVFRAPIDPRGAFERLEHTAAAPHPQLHQRSANVRADSSNSPACRRA